MKKVVMSLLGLAFSFMGSFASAIELFNPTPTLIFNDVVDFNTGGLIEVGAFSDTASFTLADDSKLTFSNFNIEVDNPLPPPTFDVGITGLQTALVDSNGATVFAIAGSGVSEILELSAGNYVLQITGDATGRIGGLYTGLISVSAVPIPAAGLLFFSGIAALGLVRSKRASA